MSTHSAKLRQKLLEEIETLQSNAAASEREVQRELGRIARRAKDNAASMERITRASDKFTEAHIKIAKTQRELHELDVDTDYVIVATINFEPSTEEE